jgi:hypothetical protein
MYRGTEGREGKVDRKRGQGHRTLPPSPPTRTPYHASAQELKTDQLFHNFVPANNTKFPEISVRRGVEILE